MAQPNYGPPADRWNVNMPAVIGVVFVFLLVVVVWVITSSGSGDDAAATTTVPGSVASTTAPTTIAVPAGVVTPTTTPPPMPDLAATTVPTTEATTTTTTTAPPAPPTTAPGADPGAVLGDLAIAGRPMQAPPCDGSFITVIASAVGPEATAGGIAAVLDAYPGSNYLRTDQTCSSLNPSVDGQPIYVVFFGPFPFASDACAARADGTEGSYARQLSNDVPPTHAVACE
jgi:serine/threonine-protein kinase